MASISNDKNGKRRTIWLGKMSKKAAASLSVRIDELLQNRIAGASHSAELIAWVRDLPAVTRNKLVRAGLLDAAPAVLTVEALIGRFIEGQHVKRATMDAYRQTIGSLKDHLGAGTLSNRVTAADADAWRKSLATDGHSTATIAKRVIVAKGIFSRALRWKLLAESPFEHLKAGSQANPSRAMHINRNAILALCRFAGLGCPSKLAELRWSDINWETVVMTVRSPKTEHHDGKRVRVVPVDPVLQPILWTLREDSPGSVDRVLPRPASAANLRTGFRRILSRAGVEPWPRLFQNLRASCETDWVEDFPAHQVAKWLGHSPAVAREHYLQPRDHHVRKASGCGVGWIKAAPFESRIAECITEGAENASQHGAAPSRTPKQLESQTNVAWGFTLLDATRSENLHATKVGGEGFEPPLIPEGFEGSVKAAQKAAHGARGAGGGRPCEPCRDVATDHDHYGGGAPAAIGAACYKRERERVPAGDPRVVQPIGPRLAASQHCRPEGPADRFERDRSRGSELDRRSASQQSQRNPLLRRDWRKEVDERCCWDARGTTQPRSHIPGHGVRRVVADATSRVGGGCTGSGAIGPRRNSGFGCHTRALATAIELRASRPSSR